MKKFVSVLLVGLVALTIVGCQKAGKSIVGSWENSGYVYTFYDDNTGTYSAGESKMKFTYEDNGKKVSILYKGNTVASEYEYKVSGNKLTIKDSFGNDVVYEKK